MESKTYDKFSGVFYDAFSVDSDKCVQFDSKEFYPGIIKRFYIKKVIYNRPATIVFWSDGTKTVSKCSPEDSYVRETGLAICVLKKLTSSAQVKNLFDDWVKYSTDEISIADVRKKHR